LGTVCSAVKSAFSCGGRCSCRNWPILRVDDVLVRCPRPPSMGVIGQLEGPPTAEVCFPQGYVITRRGIHGGGLGGVYPPQLDHPQGRIPPRVTTQNDRSEISSTLALLSGSPVARNCLVGCFMTTNVITRRGIPRIRGSIFPKGK